MRRLTRDLRTFRQGATCTLLSLALLAAVTAEAAADVTQYSLEELMAMEITSVAKKPQRLSDTAAAIRVITAGDIRRSGMTSIPELLRMVPGLHVARIDANKWAVSSRGFNDIWANKLLVLMDGRALYTPLFSGVYWDVQDTPLDDIERIEVILGPGGTLWGANAVNGVINIITRHSRDTQGGLISALAGDREQVATLRYGTTVGNDGWIRGYAKGKKIDNFEDHDSSTAHDAWDLQQAGFRADWEPTSRDAFKLQGDIYKGNADQTIGNLENLLSTTELKQDTADFNGGNLLLHWQRTLGEDSDWELQAYFDRAERDDITLEQRIDTLDLNFQHRFPLTGWQEITWGLGYRRIADDLDGTFTVSFNPDSREQGLYSAFVQDEIHLQHDLRLTLGCKFEHNDFTGFEYQPSGRLLWQVAQGHSLWGAVSRAVRVPSRSDTDIRINVATFPGGPPPAAPTLLSIFGNTDVESERLLAFELGYRSQPRPDVSLDVATFYHSYDDLNTSERNFGFEPSPAPPHALIADTFDNKMEGESYGLELAANWQVTPKWRLYAGYSWQKIDVRLDSTSTDTDTVGQREGSNPEQQFQLRSQWDISDTLELDTALYFVDSIETRSAGDFVHVPAYTRVDVRLGWRPLKNFELILGCRNLLEDQHSEFITNNVTSSEVPRVLYGQIKVRF